MKNNIGNLGYLTGTDVATFVKNQKSHLDFILNSIANESAKPDADADLVKENFDEHQAEAVDEGPTEFEPDSVQTDLDNELPYGPEPKYL